MQKIYLLLLIVAFASCSNDSDETKKIAETGFPFKVTIIASEIENNMDTQNRFQIDLEKGTESPAIPVNINQQLGYPKNAASRLINNTLSFQSQENDELHLWRKNLINNQVLSKETISLEIPLMECTFPYPIPVGNKLITTCTIDNKESIISYDSSSKKIQIAPVGENTVGWGSNTLIVNDDYLFFGYNDYDTRLENGNPSRFINIYEWSTLKKIRTVNVDPYQGFALDGKKLLMGGNLGYKLYDFVNDRVESEGERLPNGISGQFFSSRPLLNNKIGVHDYNQLFGYIPGIYDLSSKQVRYIKRDEVFNQFDDIQNATTIEIVNYEVHLKFEIAVIGYRYYDTENQQHYGVAYVTMDSQVLSNTEIPYYPGRIFFLQ